MFDDDGPDTDEVDRDGRGEDPRSRLRHSVRTLSFDRLADRDGRSARVSRDDQRIFRGSAAVTTSDRVGLQWVWTHYFMVGEDARAGMNLGSIIFGFGLGVFVTAIFFKVYLIRIGLGID